MQHDEFRIGETFWCGGQRWRCTDIGTRTIVAICIDHVEVGGNVPELRRMLGHAGAEAEAVAAAAATGSTAPPRRLTASVAGCTCQKQISPPSPASATSDVHSGRVMFRRDFMYNPYQQSV
jgi:hypothetical protein